MLGGEFYRRSAARYRRLSLLSAAIAALISLQSTLVHSDFPIVRSSAGDRIEVATLEFYYLR